MDFPVFNVWFRDVKREDLWQDPLPECGRDARAPEGRSVVVDLVKGPCCAKTQLRTYSIHYPLAVKGRDLWQDPLTSRYLVETNLI